MATAIQKVAVIGAGVMGAGIAAQCANAGVEVLLLDIVPKDGKDRDAIAKGAIEKLKKTNPAPLMHASFAKRITPGNIDDHLKKIAECDWVIEAIIERLDLKQALYKKIDKHRKKGAVVSSNTSTIPLDVLTKGMPKDFTKHFMITHFFNPPRYMRLLELVTGSANDKKAIARIRSFADESLGKTVVDCKDTPGFIANRIGTFWLHAATVKAIEQNISVEAADAVLGKPAGIPGTGIFGLLDLVGLDLMPHVLKSMTEALPKSDAFQALGPAPKLLEKMIADGYTGRKGKGGFYRLNDKREKEVLNLQTQQYTAAKRPKIAAALAAKKGGLKATLTHDSAEGHYAWSVLAATLSYAADLVPEIADDIYSVDAAMKLGYNWKYGPFELMDKLGTAWFADQLTTQGHPVPAMLKVAKDRPFYRVQKGKLEMLMPNGKYAVVERPDGVLLLEDIKRATAPLFGNRSAKVWNIGDDVACLEFTSKMNSLNPLIMSVLNKALRELPGMGYKGLVIYNEGSNFSVGANIALLLITAKLRLWPAINWILKSGQYTFKRMKEAPFPVVGAPSGMALGGGCEILLHCNALEAHAESYIGLVEAGVGIVPGWGGCKEMLLRWMADKTLPKGPMPPVMKVFEMVAMAKVSRSAAEAREMLILRPDDGIVMNRDRVLAAAKARALRMAKKFEAPQPQMLPLPGPTGYAALHMGVLDFAAKGVATPHDVTVGAELAKVITGDKTDFTLPVSEDEVLRLERRGIINLAKTRQTRARVAHMLKTGKPLRN